MTIMPHVEATGILVHTPVTHGHIITITAQGKQKITKEQALEAFKTHDRIRVVRIADGFLGNASMFKYARDLGNPRGDTPWCRTPECRLLHKHLRTSGQTYTGHTACPFP